jgi:hypothetical protein
VVVDGLWGGVCGERAVSAVGCDDRVKSGEEGARLGNNHLPPPTKLNSAALHPPPHTGNHNHLAYASCMHAILYHAVLYVNQANHTRS